MSYPYVIWDLNVCDLFLQMVTVTIDGWCDIGLSVAHGPEIGNYTCAGRATQILEER